MSSTTQLTKEKFAAGVKRLYQKINAFNLNSPNKRTFKLVVRDKECGVMFEKIALILASYADVFTLDTNKDIISVNPKHDSCEKITQAVGEVFRDLRSKHLFKELDGWRGEEFNVKSRFADPEVLFRIERAASGLVGVRSYGSHINGYVKKNGQYFLWIARRSKTKQTFPFMLDNFTAGGLTAGLSPLECARKELEEEAGVSEEISARLKMADALTYAYFKDNTVNREAEFVFDIKLPADFKPENKDGEVHEFYFMNLEEVKNALISDEFKPNSAAVTLNFLFRKGLVTIDELPNYLEILDNFHAPGF